MDIIERIRERARANPRRIVFPEGEDPRIREAAALDDVTAFVVACPKDITMYRDAVKTTGNEDQMVVKDLIELVAEACDGS